MSQNIPQFSVAEFSKAIKLTIENAFGYVKISGEITGFKRASSGHLYFNGKVIGLSKYTRIAQWCARRGTLQEALCNDIANEIEKATGARDLGVYIQATHGCCENRGIMAHSSLTQTTVLKGAFKDDAGTKKEFMDNINLQQQFAPR